MTPWQQYKLLKQAREQGDIPAFFQQWKVIEAMPEAHVDTTLGNVMLLEAIKLKDILAWDDSSFASRIVSLLESLRLHFSLNPQECTWYVAGLRMALSVSEDYPQFVDFTQWWGLEHLQPKDFRPYTPKNSKPGMPLAERTYLTVGEATLKDPAVDDERIEGFFHQLQMVRQQHPEFLLLGLIESKILLRLGQPEEALPKIRRYLAIRPRDWEAWTVLAACAAAMDNLQAEAACYARAITFQRNEQLLLPVREKLARALEKLSLTEEACVETSLVASACEQAGMVIPDSLQNLIHSLDCAEDPTQRSNRQFYTSVQSEAMRFASEGFPEIQGIFLQMVAGKQRNERRLLVQTEGKRARTYPSWLTTESLEPGDYIEMVTHPKEPFNACMIRTLRRRPSLDFAKDVFGDLRVHPKGFGFLEDVFVPPHFIPEEASYTEPNVHVRAVLSLDKTKNQWGWKAVRLTMP